MTSRALSFHEAVRLVEPNQSGPLRPLYADAHDRDCFELYIPKTRGGPHSTMNARTGGCIIYFGFENFERGMQRDWEQLSGTEERRKTHTQTHTNERESERERDRQGEEGRFCISERAGRACAEEAFVFVLNSVHGIAEKETSERRREGEREKERQGGKEERR